MNLGWNNFSTQWKRSAPTAMMFPPGSLSVFRRGFELCVVIHTKVTLCDIPSNLPHCGRSETVPSLSEVLQEILCIITASQAKGGVMQSVTFVDGHCVRHSVTRVHRDVRRASRNVQKQSGSPCTWRAPSTSQNMVCVMLSVSLGVQKNFREQNGILFRETNPEFVVCKIFLHVGPNRDDIALFFHLEDAFRFLPISAFSLRISSFLGVQSVSALPFTCSNYSLAGDSRCH